MKTILIVIAFSLLLSCTGIQGIILDTDLDSDVDDVQTLSLLHAYQKKGMVQIKGIAVTSRDTLAPLAADAINTFYGFPNIPIGFLTHQDDKKNFSKYTKSIAENFSQDLVSYKKAKETTKMYRKILAKSPDHSVILVTIGHLSGFQALLKSGPDDLSDLSGNELAHKKIKKWICMGGQYPEGREANFYRPDPLSTVYCIENWRNPVVFCGWEVGNQIITGGEYLKQNLPKNSPLYLGFELYNNFSGRPAWDQVAVLMLDKKTSKYFSIDYDGYVEVAKDGSNKWIKGETLKDKKHGIVSIKEGVDPAVIARYIDDLSLFSKP